MVVRVFNSCIVLLTVLYVCFGATNAASIKVGARSVDAYTPAAAAKHAQQRIARQAYSDEDDSEEYADVQAQNYALQQQALDDSQEESEEDGEYGGSGERRRRRETPAAEAEKIEQSELPVQEMESMTVPEPLPAPATSEQIDAGKEPVVPVVDTAIVASTTAAPASNTSVLILIRDALKKVTTLPTEQVATNALQYFQLFQHFIQQTIEEAIGDEDDDEDEDPAVAETTTKPDAIFTPDEVELIEGVEEILKEPELVTKQPEAVKPAETQMEVAHQKPMESESIVGSTKPAPDGPITVSVQQEKPADIAVPAKVESPTKTV